MTTDITKLAQREKFEAWLSEKPFHARYMHWSNTLNAYDYTSIQLAWEAYQAGGAELVEALEKAQQRIAELEEAEQKLCAANVTLDARAELAERQLQSRTVRLPKEHSATEFLFPVAVYSAQELTAALAAQGIKVEAE
ncbi:hypothetical protein ACX64P_20380 [Raoultella ornithinolytica]